MGDRLEEYRRKRHAGRTSEPMPEGPLPAGGDDTFVIQQHHARRLHWDLRLERGGVLVSWALPRGVPRDPARNHLAVHTEDHPLEYAGFHGEIPEGEYGAGRMTIYDRGSYTTEKWRDDEVIVTLRGSRVGGRYALFRTRGKDWMIHRMDPPEPGWAPVPERVAPMTATRAARLPADDAAWAYEMTWDGLRAVAYVSGGRLRLLAPGGGAGGGGAGDQAAGGTGGGAGDEEVTAAYPELRRLAEALAPTECVLDGEIVAFDGQGRISRDALRRRGEVTQAGTPRAAASRTPVQFLVLDLLWLDGEPTVDLPYDRRRELLDALELSGPHWQTPPHSPGGGAYALEAAREQGLPGVTAKRRDSAYRPGRRTRHWLRIPA